MPIHGSGRPRRSVLGRIVFKGMGTVPGEPCLRCAVVGAVGGQFGAQVGGPSASGPRGYLICSEGVCSRSLGSLLVRFSRAEVLRHYVRLATERDLGSRRDWLEFVAGNPDLDP